MYIHVKVKTSQKNESVREVGENRFEFEIREEAKRNEANKKIILLVRELYKEATEVKIVNGHHSPSKLISVTIPNITN
jgi:uncharacterized protein YggU (UPF0235/DUF167 family)